MAGEPSSPPGGEAAAPPTSTVSSRILAARQAAEPAPSSPLASTRILAARQSLDPTPTRSRGGFWANRRRAYFAVGIASMLLVAIIAGAAYYWAHRSPQAEDYVEVYVTDLPANFTQLEVRIAGVFVGEPNYRLDLQAPTFDLLSLRGPEDALKVASGTIPAGDHQAVHLVFQSARALLNGVWINLELPQGLLTIDHDFNTDQSQSSAFLFDIDLEQSVLVENGTLVFRPHVDAVYMHSYTTGAVTQIGGSGGADPKPDFAADGKQTPRGQELGEPKLGMTPSNPFDPDPTPTSKFNWGGPTKQPTGSPTTSPASSTPAASETEQLLPTVGGADSVPSDPGEIGGWFVTFKDDVDSPEEMFDAVNDTAELVFIFGSVAGAYVFATPEDAYELSQRTDVEYVEADRSVVTNMQSAGAAIQLPELHDPLFGLTDDQGNPLDGRGVGVAIIDIGFDGTHPDLPHRLVKPTGYLLRANYKVESLFSVDAPNTDVTGGHGTHVLGILAGQGVLDPTQKGVAPGVQVHGFAIGDASTTLWPVTALDWLVQNHDQVDPPIRVVSNSWGSGNTYDANSITTRLVNMLVAEGVVVVFSAGNAAGDGSLATTTAQCQIPTPGVLCVAAYDDQNTGGRDGKIAPYSSRGKIGDPATWPDLSAPGTSVRSTRPLVGLTTGIGVLDHYTALSGTSMAAPQVSGVAALMLQADPDLSPAQVDSILKASAHKFSDGGPYASSGSHHAKGHGLLDAHEALADVQGA